MRVGLTGGVASGKSTVSRLLGELGAIMVDAEGTSFFPSLTMAMAVQQGIVATLAGIDPDRTGRSLAAAEQAWHDFGLLHHSVPRSRHD